MNAPTSKASPTLIEPPEAHNPGRGHARTLWSTGQIAALIGTTSKTVASWIDAGELKGVRFPGTRERRVHRVELRKFLVRMEYDWAVAALDASEASP